MRYNFCTLFDSYYLTRGLALYTSLEKYCNNFHLYIFSFDDRSYELLLKQKLKNATIISLREFETDELLNVKPTRTIAEYCWTSTASTIWYSINKFNLDHCTYLDADITFFSDPEPVFIEIGKSSVGITPHNFAPKLKSSEIYGKYCVQFTYFKNDLNGMKALNWWRTSCIDWCYAKMEDGRYGDQKYLDYFEKKFENVHIISNPGAGIAPWNISEYNIEFANARVFIETKNKPKEKHPLIFYHYQGLKFTEKDSHIIAQASIANISKSGLKFIYIPYINELLKIKNYIENSPFETKKIIFNRSFSKTILFFLNTKLKRYKLVRLIYYGFKKSRYNKPNRMGGDILNSPKK